MSISNFQNIYSQKTFFIEMPTQEAKKSLLIDHSEQGLKISVQQDRMAYPVKKHLIEGLPKIDLIPREFFESCYARVSKLDSKEHKVYFSMRLRGGGNQGARMTRSTQQVGSFLSGGGRTEQEIQDEVQQIFRHIQRVCLDCIQETRKLPDPPKANTARWEELNSKLDISCSHKNKNEIIFNIDERVSFLEIRKNELSKYSISLYKVLDVLAKTIAGVEIQESQVEYKKREIEQIKRERGFLSKGVNLLSVAIDAVVLDNIVPTIPGTRVENFLAGYDCMGRPPADLDAVSSWVGDSRRLRQDLMNQREKTEQSVGKCEDLLTSLRKARIDIEGKKIDVLMLKIPDLKTILDGFKILTIDF